MLAPLFFSVNMLYIHPVKNPAILLLFLSTACAAQNRYWQQQVDVTINVQLNDADNTADGFEEILYTNNSPDTLHYIWFHLWPNAYKNDKTAFSNQMLELGNTDFYFSSTAQRGYINRLDFKVAGLAAKWEDHPEHIDIIKLLLPKPLAPNEQIRITTPFHLKLPYLFSRSGHKAGTVQLTQWYPKPAVYDAQGWHPAPYLEQGEFYSEFGNYDVAVILPQPYVVAAPGLLQNEAELNWQLARRRETITIQTEKKPTSYGRHGHLKKLNGQKKTAGDTNFFKTPYPLKTLRFRQNNIHDFALIASKDFIVETDTCQLATGKLIDVFTYYTNKPNTLWTKSMAFAKEALRFYSNAVGDYPYTSVHIAESPAAGPGMEYPALALIGTANSEKELDLLIAHEVGHNWFYGALATNERDAPWLDEGINTFYEKKYSEQKYGKPTSLKALLLATSVKQKQSQPIATAAPDFTPANYPLVAYYKTAQWLAQVEKMSGAETFRQAVQTYYKQWRFKHPQEADFKKALAAALPDTSLFALLRSNGNIMEKPFSGFKILSPLAPAGIKNYLKHPVKNILLINPAAGYNIYDKAMIGGLLTNYGLPPAALQFVAVPLYATGSKKWNGIANVSYTAYTNGVFRKLQASLPGMGFSKSYRPDSNGIAQYERFYKLAPSLRATFYEPLKSSKDRWLELKTFFITERSFNTFVTKAADGLTYVRSLKNQNRYVNQLTYDVTDYRVLYPYHYHIQLQQATSFYRLNISGNYFFNYAKGGGAGVRTAFVKFGFLTGDASQRLATSRFQPKLLGNTGDEDYTYSTYFPGRTASYANDASVVKNSGLAAQQILLRDGAFKLRMDAFEFLQGRSESWIAALNFTTTLPRQLLPPSFPLKLFLDIGTFAEAKKTQSETSRMLYAGGLQLSFLRNAVTIYAPVVYSRIFRDNLKTLPEQNTFLKRLTFSINPEAFSLQRLTRNKAFF